MATGMFEKLSYLIVIIGALGCLGLLDKKLGLVFANDTVRALKTMTIGYIIFIIWDALGIKLHIFFAGQSKFMTHIELFPQFMLEELFFLALLVYLPLVLWEVAQKFELPRNHT